MGCRPYAGENLGMDHVLVVTRNIGLKMSTPRAKLSLLLVTINQYEMVVMFSELSVLTLTGLFAVLLKLIVLWRPPIPIILAGK